jgi:hypothetical protein
LFLYLVCSIYKIIIKNNDNDNSKKKAKEVIVAAATAKVKAKEGGWWDALSWIHYEDGGGDPASTHVKEEK